MEMERDVETYEVHYDKLIFFIMCKYYMNGMTQYPTQWWTVNHLSSA